MCISVVFFPLVWKKSKLAKISTFDQCRKNGVSPCGWCVYVLLFCKYQCKMSRIRTYRTSSRSQKPSWNQQKRWAQAKWTAIYAWGFATDGLRRQGSMEQALNLAMKPTVNVFSHCFPSWRPGCVSVLNEAEEENSCTFWASIRGDWTANAHYTEENKKWDNDRLIGKKW